MAEPATPGWHPDPERAGQLRWWNGLGWSDARKPMVGGPVVPVAPSTAAAPASAAPPGSAARRPSRGAAPSGLATPALGLGVLSGVFGLGVIPAVGAILLGVAALVRAAGPARGDRRAGGIGPALIGVVLGLIGVVRAVAGAGFDFSTLSNL